VFQRYGIVAQKESTHRPLSFESYSKEESVEIDTNMVSDKTSTLAGDSAISDSSSEPEKGSKSSSDRIHKADTQRS